VGRVSMDMLAVDLTHAARRPASGSEVTLWGEGPGGSACWPSTRWRRPPAPSATS
jgi:alanine racemase